MRFLRQAFLSILAGASFAVLSVGEDHPPSAKKDRDDTTAKSRSIEDWFKLLASEDAKTREAATDALSKHENLFVPLHEGLSHPDAEVRRLVRAILEAQRQSLKKKVIREIPNLAKKGEVERYVERMVSLGPEAPEEAWAAGLELSKDLWRRAVEQEKTLIRFPDRPFLTNKLHFADILATGPAPGTDLRIAAIKVNTPHDIVRSFVICREMAQIAMIEDSVLLANGSFRGAGLRGGEINQSLVCCDGDIDASIAIGSVLIASGSVRVRVLAPPCVVIENERNPLVFLKRFAPSQVGIDVKAVVGAVEITELRGERNSFAEAGLKTSDRVLTVGGETPKSADEFRRMIRKHSLGYEATTVKAATASGTKDFTILIKD
jgi:hypothetical protein